MAEQSRGDVLQKLAELVSDGAAKQYDDYSKTFVALDGKAQAAGTSGGVLLGVIVALANAGTFKELATFTPWTLVLLLFPVTPALYAMVKALNASWVADVKVPFDFERQAKEFNNLRGLTPEDKIEQRDIVDFHQLRHEQWRTTLKDIAAKVNEKGALVRKAQRGVVWSTVLTAIVFGMAVVVKYI